MNAGFSNLAKLKAYVLGDSLKAQAQFDERLKGLGLGMAALIEAHCGRRFDYMANAVDSFSADRMSWVVLRYPITDVASIEISRGYPPIWTPTGLTVLGSVDEAAGLLQFTGLLGDDRTRVRVTYAGGYWWDTNEVTPDSAPAGVPPIPNDIVQAWFIQVRDVWDKSDAHGLGNTAPPDQFVQPAKLELLPLVKQMLMKHRRMQLS